MMFSITNNINPVSLLPSSSSYHPFPPPLSAHHDHHINDTFLHHHDLLMGPFLPTNYNNPQIYDQSFINITDHHQQQQQNIGCGSLINTNGDQHYGFSSSFIPSKMPMKKDRHSKIYTAQGLRDRRVRLSIEIAREFFDLQDMLGFDKASKTLGWLLKKSRKAIKELAQMKKKSCNNNGGGVNYYSLSPPTSECKVVISDYENSSKSLVGSSEETKMKDFHKATLHLLAKESREKARERARERTREKMCTRTIKLQEWKKCPETGTTTTSPQILNQFRSLNQSEECDNMTSSFKVVGHEEIDEDSRSSHLPLTNKVPREEDVLEESILIKRKLKPSSNLGNYPQNLAMSKDVISCTTTTNNYFPNFPQNWDINGAIAHSTFRAITNMNLSSGLQIYGEPWETRDNQCLY